MPTITAITEQKRRGNRRNIFLDGQFAFGCNLNVVARFRLTVGKELSGAQIKEIEFGVVKQECFDKAIELLSHRLHSRAELLAKLKRRDWGDRVIEAVLDELKRLEYLDDTRFAKTKAAISAQQKHHGRRRAFLELIRSGVKGEVAERAIEDVYAPLDSSDMARDLARKFLAQHRKSDPQTARRRLAGMLQRRGFDYESIRPILDEFAATSESDG
jgi:regulatory protein